MALTLLEEEIDDVETEIERRRHSDVAKPGARRRSSDSQAVEVALVWDQPRHRFVAVENGNALPPAHLPEILTQSGLELRDLHARHNEIIVKNSHEIGPAGTFLQVTVVSVDPAEVREDFENYVV
jgi:hypothetical protein